MPDAILLILRDPAVGAAGVCLSDHSCQLHVSANAVIRRDRQRWQLLLDRPAEIDLLPQVSGNRWRRLVPWPEQRARKKNGRSLLVHTLPTCVGKAQRSGVDGVHAAE